MGSFLAIDLLNNKDNKLFFLIRSKNQEEAINKLNRTLRKIVNLYNLPNDRIEIILGDISIPNFGLDSKEKDLLCHTIDQVFHCAAITDFDYPMDIISRTNVDGTKNVMEWGLECLKLGRSVKINHISTTYIAGTIKNKKIFYESDLNVSQEFNNTYEATKFKAELVAETYKEMGLAIKIFRTTVIIGDSVNGMALNMKSFYQILHLLSTKQFTQLPANNSSIMNFLPVDYIVRAISKISDTNKDTTYHIVSPDDYTFGAFVRAASTFFGFSAPDLIPLEQFDMKSLTGAQKRMIQYFVPYMNYSVSFNSEKTKKTLDELGVKLNSINEAMLKRMFEYAIKIGFVKRDIKLIANTRFN